MGDRPTSSEVAQFPCATIRRLLSQFMQGCFPSMRIGLLAQLLSFREGYRQAGVSRYIEHLLRHLPDVLAPSDRISVFAGSGAGVESGTSSEIFPDSLDWELTRWPTGKAPVRILWEQLAAPLLAARKRVDLIHGPVNIVPLASFRPSIVTIHDLAFLEYPDQYPAMQRRYLSAMTRLATRRASRVIAVSSYTARDISERLGVDSARVVAVPNGVSESFFPRRDTPELTIFREQHALPGDFLLFVGTLQPRKNLVGLLRAYGQLGPEERLPLYVVGGEGWMYSDIFDEVRRLGIEDAVHFPGYAASETLPLWYSAATAFIYPSYYEGFGLPVLEAMACGTPVVTSNRTSLPEVVGDAGLLVNPDNPEDIARGLREILADTERRDVMASAGLVQAKQFTWRRTARETAAVYRDVLNEG